jgi:pantetheine-phosphate adenylyltransferase
MPLPKWKTKTAHLAAGKAMRESKAKSKHSPQYGLVAMGGTFDVLHRGHRRLLKEAFSVGRRVAIGITTERFVRTLHKPHKVDSYEERKRDLERLLSRWGVLSRTQIIPLDDRYGPTTSSSQIQALVVSRRTVETGYEINRRRKAKGLKPLAIVPIDLIMAEDERLISSTRIRRGKIDREGRLVS